jgi:hypothetical protein
MSPFIATPSGLSSEALALFDRPLGEVWTELIAFDFDAPAELFSSANRGAARGPMQYRRFATGAQAVRYANEELPAALLGGSVIQVDENRFDARQIRELYDCPAYPLARAA